MKKIILCLVLLCGGFTASGVMLAIPTTDGPTCPPNSPCLYTGIAKTDRGASKEISVHRLDNTTDLVAKFIVNGKTETAYVFPSGNYDGKWYFNWDGQKYWFEM